MGMHEYELNGVKLNINMNDADFVEKYTNAFTQMQEESKTIEKVGNHADIMRGYCNMFFHLFDNIFGPGTAEALFHGKHDQEVCEETYINFVNICKEQVEQAAKRRAAFISGANVYPLSK